MPDMEAIHELMQRYDNDKALVSPNDRLGGGLDLLIPRLERATLNQAISDEASTGRYGIRANTAQDFLVDALEAIDGEPHSPRKTAHDCRDQFSRWAH